MCGILGAFDPIKHKVTSYEVMIKMRDKMTHRGPDDSGIWYAKYNRCGLAHRRLAIIDLSSVAAQPMTNKDESVAIVFNGEIYNHAEIRRELEQLNKYHWKTDHADTEVIVHAYEEWGLKAFDRFQGMFAVAIYDDRNPEKPRLHLIRDRIGIKPLYFTKTINGEWLFASEIRALLVHPDVITAMDKTAFWHYLTFVVTPAPMTLFRDIWKIPAGYRITIDHSGKAQAEQWWDCQPSAANTFSEEDLSFEDAGDEVLRLLRQSISRRMVSDVPFGVLLSGGVDSSMNVALMSELMDRPVTTFTIGYETYENGNEFEHASRIAKRYGTDHHERRINSKDVQEFLPKLVQLQDEPIADNVCIPLYFLSELVRNSGTTVVQVGEGADENFLGYWWCDHYLQKYQQVYSRALKNTKQTFLQKLFCQSSRVLNAESDEDKFIIKRANNREELFWGGAVCWWGDLRQQLTPHYEPFQQELNCPVNGLLPESFMKLNSHEIVNQYLARHNVKYQHPEILQKIPYMEHKLRLPEHLLMRVDKMTMAHSIEARVPFLDHELVEFCMKLPYSYKLNNSVGKFILKKIAEPFLDHDLIYRRKQGFGAPMEDWFKETEFGRRTIAAVNRSALFKDGYLNKDCIKGMLKHQMGRGGGWSFHLWTVLNACLWYDLWIDRNANCF